jgi:hypothetical protein
MSLVTALIKNKTAKLSFFSQTGSYVQGTSRITIKNNARTYHETRTYFSLHYASFFRLYLKISILIS